MQVGRQPKTVPLIYGGLSALLLIAIAALALVFVPPSPPSVAEFSPQAEEQIENAPEQQSSQFGSGAGACAVGQVCEEGTAGRQAQGSRKIIEKARVRRCVGDPPRQIEDPQSPPCVNYFEGDNGGATSKGVTRDEIRVARIFLNANVTRVNEALVRYFNRRFEFYGRQIRLMTYNHRVSNTNADVIRSNAVRVDQELKAFAALPWPGGLYSTPYFEELARRKVIGIDGIPSERTEKEYYEPHHPYLWSFPMSLDRGQRNMGQWVCNGLANKNAAYAGIEFQFSQRVFAILHSREQPGNVLTDPSAFTAELGRCGIKPARVVEFSSGADDTTMRTIMADFRKDGITTIACFCLDLSLTFRAMNGAESTAYFPEWLLAPMAGQDSGSEMPPGQRTHAFGLTSLNRPNPYSDSPWYWAVNEEDPTFSPQLSGQTTDLSNAITMNQHYTALLLLATGIQMAGPNLTPVTFEQGLFRTRFSNPGAGATPLYQARVGFGPGSHTMTQDLGMIWYDDTADAYDSTGASSKGAFCFLGKGIRYGLGEWPVGDYRFYDRSEPCR